MKKTCLAMTLLVMFFATSANWMSAAEPVHQNACNLGRTIKVTMKYLLYLPKDYEQKPSWPLVLFLHGSGERGDDPNLVKKSGPPKLVEAGQQFPFIIVSPQCPKGQFGWEPYELTALLDEIVEKYKVDQDRIYVTGLSMGGFGTWALAIHTPNRFAALVPICGGGDTNWAKRIAHIPAWVFVGAKDTAISVEVSQKMVVALKKKGGDPKFTIYPDAGHDAWTQTYANPQVYEWLLQQKRVPRKAETEKPSKTEWASAFSVDKTKLVSTGKTPYFILEPGYCLRYQGDKATLTVTVLRETKLVDGVETRIVEEREEKNGKPTEISRNYFAIDKTTNAVYYFGEDVDMYKEGKVVNHEGSWLSGVGGAKFGLMMPGTPKVGDKFQQEVAPKVAMDRCEIVGIGEEVTTPAGVFKNCLRVKDTSGIESGTTVKLYAPGVGLVKDDEFVLVKP